MLVSPGSLLKLGKQFNSICIPTPCTTNWKLSKPEQLQSSLLLIFSWDHCLDVWKLLFHIWPPFFSPIISGRRVNLFPVTPSWSEVVLQKYFLGITKILSTLQTLLKDVRNLQVTLTCTLKTIVLLPGPQIFKLLVWNQFLIENLNSKPHLRKNDEWCGYEETYEPSTFDSLLVSIYPKAFPPKSSSE